MARVEPHGVGSTLHVIKRGARGSPIVRDLEDKQQFCRALFYLNDIHFHENWKRDTAGLGLFGRPAVWSDREPLVDVLAWTLLSNHFHLILSERVEGGIGKFMQRLCGSMSRSFNQKYKERGSLFQGAYKGKLVPEDVYFRQLVWYVLVKNVLEMRPGSIRQALREFDKAWEWGLNYHFSSFGASMRKEGSPILSDPDGLVKNVLTSSDFKKDAKDFLQTHNFKSEELATFALEDW